MRKEIQWFHLEHLQNEIFTPDITFSYIFYKFCGVEIMSVYFNPEETIIEISNSFYWQNITLEFFVYRMKKFINFSIDPWVYTTNKIQSYAVKRCSITEGTTMKYLFQNVQYTNW